ncbi:MAG: ATP-dependent RNA helicase HrpA [Phycisphaerales bacterium]
MSDSNPSPDPRPAGEAPAQPGSAAIEFEPGNLPPSVRRRFAGLLRRLRSGRLQGHARVRAVTAMLAAAEARRLRAAMPMSIAPPPQELPIAARWDALGEAIARHRVVVVRGATGSGKSTQIPRLCVSIGRGVEGRIAVTQPRRIAARAIATRLADSCGVAVGTGVGWRTRFERRLSAGTRIEVCTDGVLAASLGRDPLLRDFDTVILDEAHERSVTIDLLLGALRNAVLRRNDLRVVIASATIAAEAFSTFFGGAPVIDVPGRQHPVELVHRPIESEADSDADAAVIEAMALGIEEAVDRQAGAAGDVLAFLPTTRMIDELTDVLRGRLGGVPLLPLHARLDQAAQDAAFREPSSTRVILATNVAETSLTLPWVRSVVDSGLARVKRYDPRRRIARLRVEPISRASAAQRAGRCGRVGPGVCIRLYSEEELAKRPEFTPPEILRTGLAGTMLELADRRLPPIESFPWIDPPSAVRIEEAKRTLREIGAIETSRDEEGRPVERLGAVARRLARLPLDPRLGRIVDGGLEEGCPVEAIVLAAALASPDPRLAERSDGRESVEPDPSREADPQLRDARSDFLSTLRLWQAWSAREAEGGSSAQRRWARRHRLNHAALREWSATVRQLAGLVRRVWKVGLPSSLEVPPAIDPVRVHRAVLRGLVGGVAVKVPREASSTREPRREEGDFITVDGVRASIWPGSSLPREHGGLVVSAEIVETSRRWLRTAAPIRASWVEQLAPHLLSREHFEPHWIPETGQVAAWERVKLGAVTIVPRRRVPFGPVDPAAARQVFIQGALVEGRWRTRGRFAERNARLLAELAELEARSRRPHAALREQAVFEFYDRRVPASIHSGPSFERWRRRMEGRRPKLLWMRAKDLVGDWIVPDRMAFPDEWSVTRRDGTRLELALRYRHEPGRERDGVTLEVPVEALAAVDPQRVEWLVPGRLEEKVLAIVRGLPKALRVRLQPMKEIAAAVGSELVQPETFGSGSLFEALAVRLSRHAQERIDSATIASIDLDPSLRLRIELRGGDGEVLEASRDLPALRSRWLPESERRLEARAGREASLASWSKDRLAALEAEPLPITVAIDLDGRSVEMHPALVETSEGVSLRLEADLDRALASTHGALQRFFATAANEAIGHHLEYHPRWAEVEEAFTPHAGDTGPARTRLLSTAIARLVADVAFRIDPRTVRDARTFEARLAQGERELFTHVDRVVVSLAEAGRPRLAIVRRLDEPSPLDWAPARAAIRDRLDALDPRHPSFVAELLPGLPRSTAALLVRLDRLRGAGPRRDALDAAMIGAFEARLASTGLAPHDPRARRLRVLLEELHVATFADRLGTSEPVSPSRLERAFDEVLASRGW